MLTLTIEEALKEYVDTGEHYLYLYRDGDTIFYVGRSVQPLERLLQHLGRALPYAPDEVGQIIQEHMPESLHWTMDLYTLSDCQEAVKAHQPGNVVAFQHYLAQETFRKKAMMIAEEALIRQHRPHLNQQNATWYDNPLPDRYVKQAIVNDQITLPDTDSDY
jgi:predicted GIY-YIG superfamily endonuclease